MQHTASFDSILLLFSKIQGKRIGSDKILICTIDLGEIEFETELL